jgi:HK97 family phage major capsid protein
MDLNTARGVLSRRDELQDRAQSILDRAARSNRNLLASESKEFDKVNQELRAANYEAELVPDRLRIAVRERSIDESRDALGHPRDFGAPTMNLRSSVDDFAQMIAENRDGHVDLDLGSLLASKRTLRNGAIEHRDILTTTTGAPMPINTAATVYEYLVSESAVLASNASILNTPDGAPLRLPRFTAYSVGTAVAEGTAIPQSDPTFAHVTFGAYKHAVATEWSREAEQDSTVALGTYLGRNLGAAISQSMATELINGAGTAGPQGILASHGGTVTGGTGVAGVPTVDEIVDLVYTVGSSYQSRASFIMHPTTLAKIAKVKDTTGRSILVSSLATDVPSTILGYPVLTDSAMPTTGTSKKSIVFGDFSRFVTVRYAGPLRIEVSYDQKFTEDVAVCKAVQRIDQRIVDPSAAAVFVGAAS